MEYFLSLILDGRSVLYCVILCVGLPLVSSLSNPSPMAFSYQQRPPACDTANFRAPSGGTTDSAALTHRQEKQPEDLLEPAASLEVSALNLAALPGQSVESLNLNSLEAPSGAAAPKAPPATTFPLEIPFHTDSYGEGQSEARDLGSLLSMMPPGFGNSGQERRLRRAGANVVNGQAERARLAAAAAAVQHNTRAARNGREQQRAQKISDMIEKLKVGALAASCALLVFVFSIGARICIHRVSHFVAHRRFIQNTWV